MKVVSFLKEKTGYLVSPDAMFDVQVCMYHFLLSSDLMYPGTTEKNKEYTSIRTKYDNSNVEVDKLKIDSSLLVETLCWGS